MSYDFWNWDWKTNEWLVLFKHAVLAVMGGIAHEIAKDKQFSVVKFMVGGFVAMFTGLLTFFVCRHLQVGEYLSAVFVGLGGYTGAPLLDIAGRTFKKRVKNWGNDTP